MSDQELRLSLDALSWSDVAGHLATDPRLIIPVGALEQHGPHLPLGTNVLIARRVAINLSERFDVLRAPTFSYGVNVPSERAFAGTASLSKKVMHRALNQLLGAWEAHGVTEFVLINAHRHEPHEIALAALLTEHAQVRVVQVWDVDIAALLEEQPGPLHGGEAETSLMLHLYPDLVRMDRVRDYEPAPAEFRRYQRGQMAVPPGSGAGVMGRPSLATESKGAAIYERMIESIARGVFTVPDRESDTL